MSDVPRQKRIRLFLVELSLFRASLARFLASEPSFELIGECGTAAEAFEVLKGAPVDIVLLDFELGAEHANDLIGTARRSGFGGRFLIIAGPLDVRKSASVLKRGASGIFLKSEAPERLIQAIKIVASGDIWLDQKVIHLLTDDVTNRYGRPENQRFGGQLADRERTVLRGIQDGLSNRKIGEQMGLPESSVKNVVQRLFLKAGVNTRSQLVRMSLEEPPSPREARERKFEMEGEASLWASDRP